MDAAAHAWAQAIAAQRSDVVRVGYFGSYARGNWGVGSDLDLVIVLSASDTPFERRGIAFDTTALPVPVDLMVYTQAEWRKLQEGSSFAQTVEQEAVWLVDKLGA